MKKENTIKKRFEEVVSQKDERLVWDFVSMDFSQITENEELKYRMELLKYNWHRVHDDIVSGFQLRANPLTIESLYETALNEDIERWNYKPIARKCTWALADIGTNSAKAKLKSLANSNNEYIRNYAVKRLKNWEEEKYRKGLKLRINKFKNIIYLDTYYNRKIVIAKKSKQIITAHQSEDSIIVYQAYNSKIAEYAVENQKFGGCNFSFNRMSWIKPNFLWMMYRSGWATKENQEKILAISIPKAFFISLLREGELTSFAQSNYTGMKKWKSKLNRSNVRIQWDPHHNPLGQKLERKAIQIGIKGELLKEFATNQIEFIEDITQFVKRQRLYLNKGEIGNIQIPIETELLIGDVEIKNKLKIETETNKDYDVHAS